MDLFPLILLSVFFSSLIAKLLLFYHKKSKLPPSPPAVPILGNLLWLRRSFSDINLILRDLRNRYGPIVTLYVGSRPLIFISDHRLAHKALVSLGISFSDRPTSLPAISFLDSNQHTVTSASYGPLWRLLRRNLVSEILHPSRVKLYNDGREWVLSVLIKHLRAQSNDGSVVVAKDSLQFAMFCLLVLMCFGDNLDEKTIREIETAQRNLWFHRPSLDVFNIFPAISMYIFYNRCRTVKGLVEKQSQLYVPLIQERRERVNKRKGDYGSTEGGSVLSYVDSLHNVKLPDEGGRNLTEDEMVSLCSEFLDAGTDTTSTALEWIIAELVKHPEIQKKLFDEIESVVGTSNGAVREEDLEKMPYLKAVIMEGLRRHPPGHFLLPHAVSREIEFEGYVIPKDAAVNVMLAAIGRDDKVWENAMEFRPERFLDGDGRGVDITGSREIKMMPFGVGRRICPGLGLAMLHLEYFVANLVREFEWKAVDGDEVDLSEKFEFTFVMKNPLRARLIPRRM